MLRRAHPVLVLAAGFRTFRTERRRSARGDLRTGFERRAHGETSSRNLVTASSSVGSFCFLFLFAPSSDKKLSSRSVLSQSLVLPSFYSGSLQWCRRLRSSKSSSRSTSPSGWSWSLTRSPFSLSTAPQEASILLCTSSCSPLHHRGCHGADSLESVPPLRLRGRMVCSTAGGTTAFPCRNPLPPALGHLPCVLLEGRALPCTAG